MNKLLLALWVPFWILLTSLAFAQSVPTPPQTPNIGLYLPEFIPDTWGEDFDLNWKRIDSMFPGGVSAAGAARVCLGCTPIVPFPTSPTTGLLAVLTDGINATTCATGGGTNQNLCQWTGSTWVIVSSGGVGGGGGDFGSITSGTNTGQTLTVGNGSTLSATGTGAINATSMPVTGIVGVLTDAQIPNLNILSTGLTASRCVRTDGTSLLASATGDCMDTGTLQAGTALYCTAANASDTYTCVLTPALSTYTPGMVLNFRSTVTPNTATASVNAGPGAITITRADGTVLQTGDLLVGPFYPLSFDGTNFRMPPVSAAASGQPADNDLTAIAGLTGTGFAQRTGVDTWALTALPTTITGTANQITASAATGPVTLSIPTNPTLPGTTTGTFSGPHFGNVTSAGTSTFTGLLAIPGKTDTAYSIPYELYYSLTAPNGLKYYNDAGVLHRAVRDNDFPGIGLMVRTSVAGTANGTYSIMAPTDDAILIANGTAWENKVMPTCRPSLGQGWSYDAATNALACEAVVSSGLASLTEDANSVNSAKAIEIGLTPYVSLTRGGTITADRVYTLARDSAGDVALTTGTLTDQDLSKFNSAGVLVRAGPAFKVHQFMIGAENGAALLDADDQPSVFYNHWGQGVTITSVFCESDAGTPTINLQRDDGSPANILTSSLTCTTGGATSTTFSGTENQIASTNRVDFTMVAAGGTAKRVLISFRYTMD